MELLLEDIGARPLRGAPKIVLDALETADVGILAMDPQAGELTARMAMVQVVERRRIRYAHMVGVTPQIMQQGMRTDYKLVDRLSDKLRERMLQEIRAKAAGPAAPHNKLYRPEQDGVATTFTAFVAAGLEIRDPYQATADQVRQIQRGHLLLVMANALQPGIFSLSSWDLVGALPVPEEAVAKWVGEGDYRWVNRGGGCVLHLPGQFALYPIVALDRVGLTPGAYLERLGLVVCDLLQEFGIAGNERFQCAPHHARDRGGHARDVHRQINLRKVDEFAAALRNVHRLVADALEVGIDLHARSDETQIHGHGLLHGEQVKGESVAEFTQAVEAGQQEAADAMDEQQIPREYHDAVKHYFGRLAEKVKAGSAAPAAASGAKAGDGKAAEKK